MGVLEMGVKESARVSGVYLMLVCVGIRRVRGRERQHCAHQQSNEGLHCLDSTSRLRVSLRARSHRAPSGPHRAVASVSSRSTTHVTLSAFVHKPTLPALV